jgi:acyl-CoA thioesterase-2
MTDPMPDDPSPADLVARLVALLDLEEIDTDLYRGSRTGEFAVRVYGGQVIGQALMAACRTVGPERPAHSLHGYFIRPGNPDRPITYRVSRDRDGGSFSFRRVVAMQDGKPILNLAASFQTPEPGLAHQAEMPDVPPPEDLETEIAIARAHQHLIGADRRQMLLRPRPIEFRPIEPMARFEPTPRPPHQAHWLRTVAPLPDEPTLHRVLLAYASDMMLLGTAMLPHGLDWIGGEVVDASLDHALWIHEDLRIDDWLLYTQDSPWSGGGRGLNRGSIFTRDGRLVASVAQEGMIRVRR